MRTRRQILARLASVGVGAASLEAATARTNTAEQEGGDGPGTDIEESRTIQFTPDTSRFTVLCEYGLSEAVTEFYVRPERFDQADISIENLVHLEPLEDRPGYRWTGESKPAVEFSVGVSGTELTDIWTGYATETEAFGFQAPPGYTWRLGDSTWRTRWRNKDDTVQNVQFDGDGYAGSVFAYAGPHELRQRSVPRTVIVPKDRAEIDIRPLESVFATGNRHLDSPVAVSPQATAFVLPEKRNETEWRGTALQQDMFVSDEWIEPDGIGYTPAHEYIHTLYPSFRAPDLYWLNEALAQYYGFLLALHAGMGTFSEFLALLQADQHKDVVLANIDRETAGYPAYEKGPHVLAALDTEIRRRSEASATLADVFTRRFSSYEEFITRVTDVATDQALAEWLSRYVRTDALPSVSTAVSDYVFPGADTAQIQTGTDESGAGLGIASGAAGIGLGVALERIRHTEPDQP